MKQITSLDNSLIKNIAKLLTKKGRQAQKQFLAEGIRTCTTIIESGLKPLYMFATEELVSTATDLAGEENVYIVSVQVLNKISSVTTPSGFICVFPIPEQPSISLLDEGIVLANIQDPGNAGTLIRTCVAFGKNTVILTEGIDPWNPKVVQASAGTIAQVKIFRLSLRHLILYKKEYKLIALVVKNGKSPKTIDFNKTLLVIGSEAHGIPVELLKACDDQMTIPMPGQTESLNAATAGAIGMYLAWAPNK